MPTTSRASAVVKIAVVATSTSLGASCGVEPAPPVAPSRCEPSQASSDAAPATGCIEALPDPRPWPGRGSVRVVDAANTFGGSLSGLTYEPAGSGGPASIWAVRNTDSTLFRLISDGTLWAPDVNGGWVAGKTLLYPDGAGSPDAEGVTKSEWSSEFVYVAAERDLGRAMLVSRQSVLRYDTHQLGADLVATHEWNLTRDLPDTGPNVGLEAITWIPDEALVRASFFDEEANRAYDPMSYPNHGSGLFVVGMEANGVLYVYALDHVAGEPRRIATIASGNSGVMALEFDGERGDLWAQCDDTCQGRVSVLSIDENASSPTFGRFRLRVRFERPEGMPNLNNEGNAIPPESECVSGFKPYYWSDDTETEGHAIREGSIPCGATAFP